MQSKKTLSVFAVLALSAAVTAHANLRSTTCNLQKAGNNYTCSFSHRGDTTVIINYSAEIAKNLLSQTNHINCQFPGIQGFKGPIQSMSGGHNFKVESTSATTLSLSGINISNYQPSSMSIPISLSSWKTSNVNITCFSVSASSQFAEIDSFNVK